MSGQAWVSLVDTVAMMWWRWEMRRMRVMVASDVGLGACLVFWYWRTTLCQTVRRGHGTNARGRMMMGG